MGKLLFDESPLVVQPTLAKALGLNEAIVLQQIHYWMLNEKSGKVVDKKRWIYNSLADWKEQFGWWSESTIYRTLEALEDAKLIETGNFNRRKGDKTKWYTMNYATYALLEALIECAPTDEPALKTGGVETASFKMEQVVPEWDSIFQDGTTLPETSPEISSETSPISLAESEIPKREIPFDPSTPPTDDNFSILIKEVERRKSHITPQEYAKIGELVDEHSDIDAFIYALEEIDKRARGFNFVYFEKCLFTYEDERERKKNGGFLPAKKGDDRRAGNGSGNGNGTHRGDFRAGAAQSPVGYARPEQIPRVPG